MHNRVGRTITSLVMVGSMMLGMTGCGLVEKGNATNTDAQTATATDAETAVADEDVTFNIRPQDDYYGYINADYLWNTEIIYGDSSAGTFDACSEAIMDEQKELLTEILASEEDFEKGSPQQLIRDYYYQCKEPKKDYTKEFDKVFALIDGASSASEIANVSAKLKREYGIRTMFNLEVIRNPYATDEFAVNFSYFNCSIDLEELSKNSYAQTEARDAIANYISAYVDDYDEAKDRATNIVYMLIDVADNTDFEAVTYDLETCTNMYSLDEFGQLVSNVNVDELIDAFGVDEIPGDVINVTLVDQMKVINSYLTDDNLTMWKDYLKFSFVTSYEDYAPASYLYYEPKDETMPDDKFMENVILYMYSQMSSIYYQKYYTEEYAAAMEQIQNDMTKSYVNMINNADWLSEEGRALMIEKFNNIHFYFGGQEDVSYSEEDAKLIGANSFETAVNMSTVAYKKQLDNLGKTPRNDEWSMASQTVNAYYDTSSNSIYITRGIMHDPFFDINGDYYSNLGGLGSVIGHELSHAFDSNGIKYDMNGNYNPDWISKEDQAAFEAKQNQVIEFYDKQTLLDVYHVDGKKTLGENLADLGGVECVLGIAKTNSDKEKIFENYARTWAALYKNTNIIMALTKDEHSPDLVRVNAVLCNFDDFYEVYDVQEKDGMYIAPEERLVRW